MERNYWSSVLTQRQLSRRRMLVGTAGVTAGALALSLVGCGSGSGLTVKGDSSGLLTKPIDTTSQAKIGGTRPSSYDEDVITMDVILLNASPTYPQLIPVYSQMVKAGLDADKRPGGEEIVGDFAESWEFSEDGTQLTFHLRQDMKWDRRPPTNGRTVNSADVKFSWDKFVELGNSGGELAQARNEDAAVVSMTTPDDMTVVFNLAYPYGGILDIFANQQTFYVMPADESSGFNYAADMRGTGPYELEKFVPSASATYKRRDDWYGSPEPYFDRLERTLISDYSAGLAQFEAGRIWDFLDLKSDDVISVKKRNPGMQMQAEKEIGGGAQFFNFSKKPGDVFKDVRLRRALNMTFDRDLLLDVFFGTENFISAGLPITKYWHSHLAAGQPEWLDPRGTGLGEGAKYFEYNLAEAKKLVDASGVPQPVVAPFGYWTDRAFETVKQNEVMHAMMNEGGFFDLDLDGLAYATEWRQKRKSGGSTFDGVLAHRASALSADLIFTQKYTPGGRNSVNSFGPTPGVTDLVLKQKTELDPEKRRGIIEDIQRALALEMPDMPVPGDVPGFTLHWPWLANYGVFIQGNGSAKVFTRMWNDESKREA